MGRFTSGKNSLGQKGIFYGWWMALSCAIMNFFIGGSFFYGFTVFFNPIRQTFGWTAAQTSVAFTFQRLESGIAGLIVGFLVDIFALITLPAVPLMLLAKPPKIDSKPD